MNKILIDLKVKTQKKEKNEYAESPTAINLPCQILKKN